MTFEAADASLCITPESPLSSVDVSDMGCRTGIPSQKPRTSPQHDVAVSAERPITKQMIADGSFGCTGSLKQRTGCASKLTAGT